MAIGATAASTTIRRSLLRTVNLSRHSSSSSCIFVGDNDHTSKPPVPNLSRSSSLNAYPIVQYAQRRSIYGLASPEQRREMEKQKVVYHGLKNVRSAWRSGKYHAICETLPAARTGEVKEYPAPHEHPHHIHPHPHTDAYQHSPDQCNSTATGECSDGASSTNDQQPNNRSSQTHTNRNSNTHSRNPYARKYVQGNLSESGPDFTQYCQGESIFADEFVCFSDKYRRRQQPKTTEVVQRQQQQQQQHQRHRTASSHSSYNRKSF